VDLNDPTTVALLAADAFAAAGYQHALYGGLLTAAYGEPRETRDADLAVVELAASDARRALDGHGIHTLVAFEDVTFGGLLVSRLTVLGAAPDTGLNTIDLVRPRSRRYAALAVRRAVTSLRDQQVRVLTLEDFIVFKVLSHSHPTLMRHTAARVASAIAGMGDGKRASTREVRIASDPAGVTWFLESTNDADGASMKTPDNVFPGTPLIAVQRASAVLEAPSYVNRATCSRLPLATAERSAWTGGSGVA
jgi:hypothetical protein